MAALLTPQTAFYLASMAVLAAAVAAVLWVRPEIGLLVVGLVMAVTLNLRFAREGEPRSLAVDVAGLSVGILDLLAILMLAVAAFRRLWRGSVETWELVTWSMALLTGINAVRGLQAFPLEQVMNETRPWLYLWAVLLFSGTVRVTRSMWRTLGTGLVAYTGWLVAVAVAGFAATGVNTVTAQIQLGNYLVDPRPVAASGALVLADAMLLLIVFRRRMRRLLWLVAFVTVGLVVILLQHRTVWIAVAVGLGYAAMTAIRKGGHARRAALAASAMIAVPAIIGLTTGALQQSVLAGSASNAAGQQSTFLWRLLGWRQLVGGDRDILEVIVGEPFGRGFLRVVNDVTLTVSAHSQYVSTYLRLGLIGLVGVGWLVVLAWRGAAVAGAQLQVSPDLLRGLVILVVLYGVTYSWDPFQGVVLGLLITLSRAPRRVPDGEAGGPATTPSPPPAASGVPAIIGR